MTVFRVSQPLPDAESLQDWVLESPTQLRHVRAQLIEAILRQAPTAGGELGDVPERMLQVAIELATNAMNRGLPPTRVTLLRTADEFVVDIADHDTTTVPELDDIRPINAASRGLQLALALSLEVGWRGHRTHQTCMGGLPDP